MDEELITAMREMLEKHARVPFGIDECAALFAENPEESDEILTRLFAEYDAGCVGFEPDIRALIKVQRVARKYRSAKRSEALRKMDVQRAAYQHPPSPGRQMYLSLRGEAHGGEAPALCEDLVRDYPSIATSLLADLAIELRREHLYEMRLGAWHNPGAELDILRSMVARAECRRLIDEMGD